MAIYHKFKATPTIRDGRRFASKKEAKRYGELKHLQAAGEVLFFLSQVSLPLSRTPKNTPLKRRCFSVVHIIIFIT